MCFYIISNSKKSSYYKECVGNIRWNDRVIIFTKDVNGKRKVKQEEITIALNSITKIENSGNLKILNIQGFTIKKISFLNNDKVYIEVKIRKKKL